MNEKEKEVVTSVASKLAGLAKGLSDDGFIGRADMARVLGELSGRLYKALAEDAEDKQEGR